MSRRIAQTFLRTLRTPRLQSIQTAVLRQLPCKPRYHPRPILTVRYYATHGSRGVPIKEEEHQEQTLTPEEKERASLHKRAQYSLFFIHGANLHREKVEVDNPEEAITIYHTLLARNDLERIEKRLALFNLGVIHHRKGDSEKALTYWKDASSIPIGENEALLDSEEMELAAAAFMNLGAHHVLAKDFEKGLGYLQAAVDLDPTDGEIRYNLAATLASMGRHEDAIREFEAAEERGIEIAREVIDKIKQGLEENEKSAEKKD